MLLDDDRRVAAHCLEPGAELFGITHGCRQRCNGDCCREMNDDFLPHGSSEPVSKVVNFVHHHIAEFIEGAALGIEHVAKHLGGHHDHRSLAIDTRIAGQEPDLVCSMTIDQVVELLVG